MQPSFSHLRTAHPSLDPFLRQFTNLAMPAHTLVLTCNIALLWCLRKLKGVQFGKHGSCSGKGLWQHITSTFKAMTLRSSTRTTSCRFGRTQTIPSVNSRIIYQCAPCANKPFTTSSEFDNNAILIILLYTSDSHSPHAVKIRG